MRKMPPDYMMMLLRDLEVTILNVSEEFSKLADADVEWCCEKLIKYFKILSKGKETEEPESPSEMKQALMDELLNRLEEREAAKADSHVINNPDIRLGEMMYHNYPTLYVTAFKIIQSSARFWRKEHGRKGYLKFIDHHVV